MKYIVLIKFKVAYVNLVDITGCFVLHLNRAKATCSTYNIYFQITQLFARIIGRIIYNFSFG